MQEIWKNIIGYEGRYMISSFGRVKSILCNKEKILSLKDIRGYKNTCLWSKEKNRKTIQVHRLVAIHFIPNPLNKPQVNHINHIKDDNRIENLEWVTNSENVKHSYLDNNRTQKGENNNGSKLTNKIVIEIKTKGKYDTYKKIGKDFGLDYRQVFNILKNKTWAHIKV